MIVVRWMRRTAPIFGSMTAQPSRPGRTSVVEAPSPLQQLAVPAQDGIRTDEKPHPAQDLARTRRQERGEKSSILGGESDPGVGTQLPLKHGDLVTQGKILDVLVSISHRQ
ncbi:hypothetical protein ABZ897_49430 [Nonomuraea sp. NPDC046802]|uniref:hypothetical protein n=1 Tax=Nonomuraea sp. NPDC046802 TaxID=3154919 RepID=UPI0034045B42